MNMVLRRSLKILKWIGIVVLGLVVILLTIRPYFSKCVFDEILGIDCDPEQIKISYQQWEEMRRFQI